jgi:Co/Zn/Cd efflux system component
MFGVEVYAGALSSSVSLLADAIDFLGDAFNYGLSLSVLGVAMLAKAAWALQYGAPAQALHELLWNKGKTL